MRERERERERETTQVKIFGMYDLTLFVEIIEATTFKNLKASQPLVFQTMKNQRLCVALED